MAFVTSRTRSGLVLAEEAGDETRLIRALKALDRDLILVKERDEKYEMWVWKVLVWAGDDRPAVPVLDWREGGTGRPLPLTSGIVDAVDAQRRDRPGGYDAMKESDARNERLRAERRKDFDEGVSAVEDDFRAQLDRGRKQVSMAPDTKIPYHQRNRRLSK